MLLLRFMRLFSRSDAALKVTPAGELTTQFGHAMLGWLSILLFVELGLPVFAAGLAAFTIWAFKQGRDIVMAEDADRAVTLDDSLVDLVFHVVGVLAGAILLKGLLWPGLALILLALLARFWVIEEGA